MMVWLVPSVIDCKLTELWIQNRPLIWACRAGSKDGDTRCRCSRHSW